MLNLPLEGDVKLREMVKKAVPGAEEAMRQKGLDPTDPRHVPPWREVKEFIIKVLTLAGAVRTEEDQQILRTANAGQTVVRKLDPACRLLVLAELVFALVCKLGDMNETDKPDIALFHAADDDEIGAVEEALGFLIEKGRIVEDPRETRIYYKIKPCPEEPSVRIATPPSESA